MSDTGHTPLIFEPHGGFGTWVDGEPMPFGYLSAAPGHPIFEMNVVFEPDGEELSALMSRIVTACNALPILVEALEHVTELLVDTWHVVMPIDDDPEKEVAVINARAALASIKGGDNA